jgi:ubiquinone biosynthesis protein COQ4
MRSMRRLLAHPEETGEVFRIIEALKGGSLTQALQRLSTTDAGRRMIAARPRLVERLEDRAALARLPEGSLGRAYLDFVERQQISAEGLVEASMEAPRGEHLEPEERWMGDRLRDIHDLQHVLTGYGPDELGELCLLEFMRTQTPNRGISFIVFMGRRKYREVAPELPVEDCVREGRELARASGWLVGIEWEDRLGDSLESLRRELDLRPATLYHQTRARWPVS